MKQLQVNLKDWAAPIAGILVALLVGCGSIPAERSTNGLRETPTPSRSADPTSSPAVNQTPTQPLNQTETAENLESVTIYRADENCQELIPESVQVSATQPIEAAIGQVLSRWNTADFQLIGYRISVDPQTHVATLDLRLAPNSRRVFTSLSSCEQFDLFGSLRETLTRNDWDIDTVQFTSLGEELEL